MGGDYNFSMLTDKEDMVRAVLEGVAFAEKERADLLVNDGEHFSSMRISGGGASSSSWCQIRSDVMNIPVYALRDVDAAELGASMLISVGTDLIPNLASAISFCDLNYDKFVPKPQNAACYTENYEEFRTFEKRLSRQG
jgi:sugar (pentulose or hexulose) kinase